MLDIQIVVLKEGVDFIEESKVDRKNYTPLKKYFGCKTHGEALKQARKEFPKFKNQSLISIPLKTSKFYA